MGTGSQRDPDSGSAGLPVTPGDQPAVDEFRGDSLAVFCWSDVRPLRGAAGFVDWRLCGALSHAIEEKQFAGDLGEVVLMPVGGRLGKRRLFLFGLGPASARSDDHLRTACRGAFDVLEDAKVERVTFVTPHTLEEDDSERAFLRALGSEREGRSPLVESVLVARDGGAAKPLAVNPGVL